MKEINKADSEQTHICTIDGRQKSSLHAVSSQRQGSMESLVLWNLSKALEINRVLNFQEAISELQRTMEQSSRQLPRAVFARPQQRHLACALLAWQQLRRSTDSLVQFAESKRDELLNTDDDVKSEATLPEASDDFDTASILQQQSFLMGPVVALPIHTKLVMRVEKTPSAKDSKQSKPPSRPPSSVIKKLETSGCVELGCVAKLKELDRGTSDLRSRASKLSRREAERAELLERAELAWRELEAGFQRRLRIADEKEDQYATRIATLIEERKQHKQTCVDLIAKVKEKADMLEKRKAMMQKCEEQVCGLACLCHQLNEEVVAVDSALAEASTKFHHLDRECQLKEEQSQRRAKTLACQLEAAQQLTLEAELALRGELGALKHQIEAVSAELLKKDEKNDRLKEEIEQLMTVKLTLVEDLEACSRACDLGLQGKVQELRDKTGELSHTREHALRCTCHVPTEAAVQVKRTPSLAALCYCPPGKRDLDACSCTSLRSKLLNDLLVELFGGLRSELGDTLHALPCQMLKCLEDTHNWDQASSLKTSLQGFFSKLLVSELDIAIATAIENYHATWVGSTCADTSSLLRPVSGGPVKLAGDCGCWDGDRMRSRIEELANQMFDKRVNELQLGSLQETTLDSSNNKGYQSNNKISRGSRGSDERDPSVLYCHVPQPRKSSKERDNLPAVLKRTYNDVTQLRAQIEDLRKETIKKTDFKSMEENIIKLLQNANTRPESPTTNVNNISIEELKETVNPKLKSYKNVSHESTIKVHNYRSVHIDNSPRNFIDINKNMLNYKKRPIKDFSPPKKISKMSVYSGGQYGGGQLHRSQQKVFRKFISPAYAVNLCLCPGRKESPDSGFFRQNSVQVHNVNVSDSQPQWAARPIAQDINSNQDALKDDQQTALQSELELLKESEITPTNKETNKIPNHENSFKNVKAACRADCVCVNKIPSTSSVERLLNVLNKWKKDINTSADVISKKHSNLSSTKVILKNSDFKLNSNIISAQTLLKNSVQNSNKASSHCTKQIGVQNSNKSSIQSTKGSIQNAYRSHVQLNNKAVNSPTKAYSNITDMGEIPEVAELDKHSQISNKTLCKATDLSVDSNNELLLIISKSQNSLIRDTDYNNHKKDTKNNLLASESEYMGQTNLNKSLKHTCKCVDSYETSRCKCAESYEDKTMLQYQNPSRGTEAHACDFRDSVLQLKLKSNILGSQADAHTVPCLNGSSSKENRNPDSYYSPLVNLSNIKHNDDILSRLDDKSMTQSINKANKSDKNFTEVKRSQELSCDYNVKFLGVTLNNTNDGQESESFLINDIGYGQENKIKEKVVKNIQSFISKPTKSKLSCKKPQTDQVISCQCHDKFEDLKQYFNDVFINCKTIAANLDKSSDTQSSKSSCTNTKKTLNVEDSNPKELCVCCDEKNNPDDLEVNTFELIKDHLKNKLQELKFSSCKFTSVPYEEEEKLLTAILVKVKQVISESTKHTCMCSDVSKIQGSWNRAYALLQEYLKSKLKRIQCVCGGTPLSSEDNPLLPGDVLDKVCHLIENDFDRLRNICHAKNPENNRYEIPVKEKSANDAYNNIVVHRVDVINTILPDFNKTNKTSEEISKQSISQNHKQISKQSFLKNHKQISEQSFLKTENISSQVSNNFGEKNKCEIASSCLNFEKEMLIKHAPSLEVYETGPDYRKPKQGSELENNRKVLEYQKISNYKSLVSTESVKELNSKSDSKIPLKHNPKLIPHFGECECAATIRYQLSAQKRGVRINILKKIPSLSTQNQLNVRDCDHNRKAVGNTTFSDEIILKHSDVLDSYQSHDTHDACANNIISNSCDHYHRCLAGLASRLHQIDNDPRFHPLDYPVFEKKVQHAKSEMYPSLNDPPQSSHPACDCSLIPLCHVKMLVENIEDKLANCKCTCDSFTSNVCPVHSKLYQ